MDRPRPLAQALFERVLDGLGLSAAPSIDVAGLNLLLSAWCGSIPFDNIRKRIAISRQDQGPLPGIEPQEFFEAWLRHGTGATCWPLNGAFFALATAAGFDARRHAGTILTEEARAMGIDHANHGSVIVTIEDEQYLADPNVGSFTALPLRMGEETSTGRGIHDIRAEPRNDTFDIRFRAGTRRDELLTFQMRSDLDPVSGAFFRERYENSRDNGQSPFNAALYVTRRFPDRIVTVGRMNKIAVDEHEEVTTVELDPDGRRRALIDELGFSEEIVALIPPDEDEENFFF